MEQALIGIITFIRELDDEYDPAGCRLTNKSVQELKNHLINLFAIHWDDFEEGCELEDIFKEWETLTKSVSYHSDNSLLCKSYEKFVSHQDEESLEEFLENLKFTRYFSMLNFINCWNTSSSLPPVVTQKDSSMSSLITKAVTQNKNAAMSAALNEGGRLLNGRLTKLLKPKLPMVARGYVEHPLAKLAIANVVLIALAQFRPEGEKTLKLANAMVVSAYQELLQEIDVEGFLDELFSGREFEKFSKKMDVLEEK